MGDYKIKEKELTKKEEYIEYLDRSRRINGKSRLEIHMRLLSRLIGLSYGLNEDELNNLTEELKNKNEE